MKKAAVLMLVSALLALGGVIWWLRPTAPGNVAPSPLSPSSSPSSPAVASPAPASLPPTTGGPAIMAQPKPSVAIQDAKTIDFSSGKPVVKDSAEEKAIIEQSVREMNEAAAGVTFGPSPPPAPKK